MSTCVLCRHAQWRRTAAGRLHPDGTGTCGWEGWKNWQLPPWGRIGFSLKKRITSLGHPYISRKNPYTSDQCPYFEYDK